MRILSKLILARERQPLAQSTWAVTSPSPRKRPHLKLPNDEDDDDGDNNDDDDDDDGCFFRYLIMLNCWQQEPGDRPSFEQLRREIKLIENQHKVIF